MTPDKPLDQLDELQSMYQLILDAAGEGIYGLDAKGRITFGNAASEKILGWSPEQVLGQLAHDVHHHSHEDGSVYLHEECPIYAALKDGQVHHVDSEVFWHTDGSAVPGTPLTISSATGNQLTLSWGTSCLASDPDYEIYGGVLGDFSSHTPRFCTTAGATTITFTPAAGNMYYLVVPRSATREGSYGTDSNGMERPQGTTSCLVQAIAACP